MSNAPLTHAIVARNSAAMLEEMSPFIRNINKARQEEFGKDIQGFRPGQSVKVKLPPTGVVYTGATFAGGGSAPDFVEDYVTLTVGTQKHVPLTFTAVEKSLELTDFKDRILAPQMATLAAAIEADLISQATLATPNAVGSAGTTPTSMKTFSQARQKLQRFLAPAAPRYCLYTDDVNVELIDSTKAQFNPVTEIDKMWYDGSIGKAQGAGWFECVNLAYATVGNRAGSITINGASQTGSSLSVHCTSGDTFLQGEIITLAGSFEVHPLTGTATKTLRQFVITQNTTAAATTVSLPIYPTIDTAMPNQTVSASPTDSGAVTFFYGTTAGNTYKNSLMYQRDAYTAAFAPLPVLASCEGYTARLPSGISVRVMTFGNGLTDTESTRIDVLYGFTGVRAYHAARVTQ